jgi:hypothetical protein
MSLLIDAMALIVEAVNGRSSRPSFKEALPRHLEWSMFTVLGMSDCVLLEESWVLLKGIRNTIIVPRENRDAGKQARRDGVFIHLVDLLRHHDNCDSWEVSTQRLSLEWWKSRLSNRFDSQTPGRKYRQPPRGCLIDQLPRLLTVCLSDVSCAYSPSYLFRG